MIKVNFNLSLKKKIYTIHKNNPDFRLYYTDTDSGYFNKSLPDHAICSKTLGKLKLENIILFFLAPKVYYLET
jgi:hypothetical protein